MFLISILQLLQVRAVILGGVAAVAIITVNLSNEYVSTAHSVSELNTVKSVLCKVGGTRHSLTSMKTFLGGESRSE